MLLSTFYALALSHVCNHDSLPPIERKVQIIEQPDIHESTGATTFPYPNRSTPRIVFNFSELDKSTALNQGKICWEEGIIVNDVKCSKDDVITAEKRNVIIETFKNLQTYMEGCLKVTPMTTSIRLVPNRAEYTLAREGDEAKNCDMYYTIIPRPYSSSELNVLASASSILDESIEKRPIQGIVFINVAKLPDKAQNLNEYPNEFFITCFHELCHALGISNSTYKNWINITTRQPYFDQNAKTMHKEKKNFTIVYTPEIHKYAKKRFGVETFTFDDGEIPSGIELEDGGGSGTMGSHPEIRTYYGESMVGVSSAHSVISDLIFAMLKDTGWYEVNYTYAHGHSWGNGYSISTSPLNSFAVGAPQTSFPTHYLCKVNGTEGCTYDYTAIGECKTENYDCDKYPDDPFCQSQDFYNANRETTRGHSSVHDWIKYIIPYNNRNCLDPSNFEKPSDSKEEAGPNSRCFEYPNGKFGCFLTRCDGLDLYVKFGSYEFQCKKGGEKVGPIWQKILCPNPEFICRGMAVAQSLPENPFADDYQPALVHQTEKLGKKFPISDTLFVILIAIGIVIIIVIVVVVCVCKRSKRKSRVYAMEESESDDLPKKKKKKSHSKKEKNSKKSNDNGDQEKKKKKKKKNDDN